ncbi:uncharacterized protein L203_102444 [Cryptococcus depauperatus CBS 7841]|uniref:FHA domain-containing protein n=1 Tax=Cryptococcus depauperatus CBS 7841 TaxID=1295531 RepID=A0AAJ8JRX6_9TREE
MQHQYLSSLNQHGSIPGNQGGDPHGQMDLPWGAPFPSLHLWPIQDTFQMKMIHLPEGQRVKVGRQTNNKTVPGERNAYFDSKVLSRLHAEIWEQNGKILIKDIRSSNGTFINSERLSPEGVESDPVEIKSEDQIEFGIDIVSDDNRTIVHHRVAAKAYCVFNEEDAARSARELAAYQHDNPRMRRIPQEMHHQVVNPMAHMGPAMMSGGGKAGSLSFDHVLSKLQAELHASKETGAELQNLATTFTGIQDTLSGGVPPSQNGSAAQYIPPQFRSTSAEAQAALAGPHGQEAAAFIALQAQLNETQSNLSGYLGKIQYLETQLKEHEVVKADVQSMKEQMEYTKREMDMVLAGHRGRPLERKGNGNPELEEDVDDDDARSVATVMDDKETEDRVRERRRAEKRQRHEREQVERPSTPEPTVLDDDEDEKTGEMGEFDADATSSGGLTAREKEMLEQNNHLVFQINTLSTEITEALSLSRALQSQHTEAMSAVKLLTERISSLEDGLSSKINEEVSKAEERWESWRVRFEESWKKERNGWEKERERLRGVVREWEEASRRAHEEEEERRENERLSEDEFIDEEEGDDDNNDIEIEETNGQLDVEWEEVSSNQLTLSPARKIKRRRPSHKTVLAVRALKAVADGDSSIVSTTPKGVVDLDSEALRPILIKRSKKTKRNGDLSRNGSDRTLTLDKSRDGDGDEHCGEKDSSESGLESQDTLKKEHKVERKETRKKVQQQVVQPQTVVGVLVVAIVVGAFWYKSKE